MGFANPARAEHLITEELRLEAEGADADVLGAIAAAADPDLALSALAALVQRSGDALAAELCVALRHERGLRDRLTAVLGASAALGDHLARHPDDWRVLRGPDGLRPAGAGESRAALLTAVGADPYDAEPVALPPGLAHEWRVAQGASNTCATPVARRVPGARAERSGTLAAARMEAMRSARSVLRTGGGSSTSRRGI